MLTVAGASVIAALAGCSSGRSPKQQLQFATQQVRDAAAKGTFGDVRQAVDQLRGLVQDQVSNGDLSAQSEQAILDAAQAVLSAARPHHNTSPTTPISTPLSTPVSSPPPTNQPPTTSATTPNSSSQGNSNSKSGNSNSASEGNSNSNSNSSSNSESPLHGDGLARHPSPSPSSPSSADSSPPNSTAVRS